MLNSRFKAQVKSGLPMQKRSGNTGFMILMGINRLPEIRDYWCNSEYLHYSPIADRITRDRFEQIARYLNFADNDTLPARGGYSRLQKVDPVISILKENFRAVYYPNREVSTRP